jgi:hypothetical protein
VPAAGSPRDANVQTEAVKKFYAECVAGHALNHDEVGPGSEASSGNGGEYLRIPPILEL